MSPRKFAPGWLTSRLVSSTDGSPQSPSTTSVDAPSSTLVIQTVASVERGRTVYITVTHRPAPTSGTRPSDATLSETSHSPGRGRSLVGPITGGVVGGVILFSIALLALFFFRRRRNARERNEATLSPPYADSDMSEQLRGRE
jgi:hypothetical protein